jgi:hypothetical protein
VKYDIGDFYENSLKTRNLVKTGEKYRAIYLKTAVSVSVSDDIKWP